MTLEEIVKDDPLKYLEEIISVKKELDAIPAFQKQINYEVPEESQKWARYGTIMGVIWGRHTTGKEK